MYKTRPTVFYLIYSNVVKRESEYVYESRKTNDPILKIL